MGSVNKVPRLSFLTPLDCRKGVSISVWSIEFREQLPMIHGVILMREFAFLECSRAVDDAKAVTVERVVTCLER
jgi:hypothetical protein